MLIARKIKNAPGPYDQHWFERLSPNSAGRDFIEESPNAIWTENCGYRNGTEGETGSGKRRRGGGLGKCLSIILSCRAVERGKCYREVGASSNGCWRKNYRQKAGKGKQIRGEVHKLVGGGGRVRDRGRTRAC